MRLRQVALAAMDLHKVRQTLFKLLGVPADFADPGVGEFGLENSVMALGDTFLEVVAPVQADTAAGRTIARSGADVCGYMALFQVEDYARTAAHLKDQHVRQVWQIERPEVSACHVHPKDMGGAIVSFDEMRPPQAWLWAGPNWRDQQATGVSRIAGCRIEASDPQALCQQWARILDVPTPGNNRLELDQSFVSFEQTATPGRPDAITTVVFATDDVSGAQQRAEQLGIQSDSGIRLGACRLEFIHA